MNSFLRMGGILLLAILAIGLCFAGGSPLDNDIGAHPDSVLVAMLELDANVMPDAVSDIVGTNAFNVLTLGASEPVAYLPEAGVNVATFESRAVALLATTFLNTHRLRNSGDSGKLRGGGGAGNPVSPNGWT